MSQDSTPAPRQTAARRATCWRFRLRTLLILAPLAAIALGLGFRWYWPRYLERRAVEQVETLDGKVVRDADSGHVVGVELPGRGIDDDKLRQLVPHLKNLPQLRDLVLASNDVTDEGLLLLVDLPQLQYLYVADTKVTDAGVAKLQSLRGTLTIDRASPHVKAFKLARRAIYEHALLHLALAPDSRHILAGSGDGQLRVWDLATGEMTRSIQAHGEWTFTAVFHPDGKSLATGGGDHLVRLWSWPDLEEIGRFTGHTDDVHAVGFTPDGTRLVSAGDDLLVRIWDVARRKQRFALEGHDDTIPGLAISPSGDVAATGSRDGTVRVWSIDSGECVAVLRGHTDDVMSVAFHPSGHEMASASYDGTVRLWHVPFALQEGKAPAEPERVGNVRDWIDSPRPMVGALNGHGDWVFSVAYSPSGGELITAAGDGVRTFDRRSGRLLWKTSSQKNVSHAAWLSDAEVATASADASIAVWRASSGEQVARLWTRFTPDVTAGRKLVAE